ncbi:unnamed protein product [Parnassius mnemosyne]|uniref:MADF domain-containing protein n=1 Tax=Parnassius mnemosyne TaxID=213953 RepID=A0AAV1LKR9_9NEOP
MPYLYNKNDKNYLNKVMREEGFKVLLNIYKNYDRNGTIKILKKKIDSLKTTYFRELIKVKASRQTGAGTDNIYVPTLWYFDALNFLASPAEPCRQPVDSQVSTL